MREAQEASLTSLAKETKPSEGPEKAIFWFKSTFVGFPGGYGGYRASPTMTLKNLGEGVHGYCFLREVPGPHRRNPRQTPWLFVPSPQLPDPSHHSRH
jgi:hypothetical protein